LSRAFSPARTIGTTSWMPAKPVGLRFSAPCGSISRTSAANARRSCNSWSLWRETERGAGDRVPGGGGGKGGGGGQRWTAPAGVPAFSGVAEYYTESPYDALLRLDKPGPGIAALGAFNCGGPSMVALNFYLYGDQAAATVAHQTPLWQAWFQQRFP